MITNNNEPHMKAKQNFEIKEDLHQMNSNINQRIFNKANENKQTKDFDILDRELQIKILSSEKEKLQFGLIDFIERRKDQELNSQLDPFITLDNNTSKPFSLSTNEIKKYKLRQSNVLTNTILEFSKTKSFNEDQSFEKLNLNNRSNSLCQPDNPLLLFLNKSPSIKCKNSPIFTKKSSIIEPEEGGLKIKLLSHERNILKENFQEYDEDTLEKPIIRELFKMKPVYDSCSDEEIEDEEDNQFLIYPRSYFKYTWDLMIFLLTMLSLIYLPLTLAFDFSILSGALIDIVFFFDLMLNFWMGYYDHEENLIVSHKKIFNHYITGWFWLDLIAFMPFNFIKHFKKVELNLYCLSLCRLVKYFKISNSLNFYHTKLIKKIFCPHPIKHYLRNHIHISHGIKSLLINIFRFIAVVHILSCIWIYLSLLSPGENWAQNFNDNAPDYKSKLYLVSIYFNMVSVLTLGYGDVLPVSFIERFYLLFLLIMSLGINTYAVSFLENLSDLGNQLDSKLEDKRDFLESISIKYKVNYGLYEKILNFLNYTYKGSTDEKEKFIDYLTTSLKNLLICNMYQDIINNFTFFKLHRDDNIEFKARILLSLRPVIAYKGEEVIKVDSFVDEIIFVKFGQLSMFITFKDLHVRLLYLRKYEHFGVLLVLTREKSPVGLKVISQHKTELLLLRKSDFIGIVNDFSENLKHIFNRSCENMKRIKNLIKQKKAQIRRMLTQTKMFKQSSIHNMIGPKTFNYNSTIDFYANININKNIPKRYSLLEMNQKETSNPQHQHQQNKQNQILNTHSIKKVVSHNKNNTNEEITITLNVNNQISQTQQNLFLNINSQNTKDFNGVKEINVTINNNNSSNEMKINTDNNNDFVSPTSIPITNNKGYECNSNTLECPKIGLNKNKRFGSAICSPLTQNNKGDKILSNQFKLDEKSDLIFKKKTKKRMKSSTDLVSFEKTNDYSSFLNQNFINKTLAQNNTKKVYLNIYNSIKKKVINKSEGKKIEERLHYMFKQYLNFDIENNFICSYGSSDQEK